MRYVARQFIIAVFDVILSVSKVETEADDPDEGEWEWQLTDGADNSVLASGKSNGASAARECATQSFRSWRATNYPALKQAHISNWWRQIP
jgi:hypothetical protein